MRSEPGKPGTIKDKILVGWGESIRELGYGVLCLYFVLIKAMNPGPGTELSMYLDARVLYVSCLCNPLACSRAELLDAQMLYRVQLLLSLASLP